MTMYLIEKHGLYYRPNSQGYVGIKRFAGRYTFEEAAQIVGPNGPDGPQDGMSMWREEDAPDFSPACYRDLKDQEIGYQKGLAVSAARIEVLEARLAKADALAEALEKFLANTDSNLERHFHGLQALAAYREGSE